MKVIVIGAGIVGVSTAEHLRRDGHEVVIVDRVPPGDPRQTSFGNAGVLAASSIVPVSVPGLWRKIPGMLLRRDGPVFLKWSALPRLAPWLIGFLRRGDPEEVARIARALVDIAADSVEQHLALAKGTPAARRIQQGEYLYLYRNKAAYEADSFGRDLRQAHGMAIEPRDRAALAEMDPHLNPAFGYAAVCKSHGWIDDPGGYVADLAAHFVAEGGTIKQAEVTAITPGDPVRLATDAGEMTAERIVLAGGVWSRELARALGYKSKMVSERGYHLRFTGVNRRPAAPYMVAEGKWVATPMADGGMRCAGLAEFGLPEHPASKAPPALLLRGIKRLYPDLTWQTVESWLGHRPSTIDSLPFIGEAPKAPGVFFAYGAQHIGLTTGPKTGRLIADLINGRRPNIDLDPFRVGRFD